MTMTLTGAQLIRCIGHGGTMFYGNYRFEGPPKRKYNPFRVFLLVIVLICLLVSVIVIASYLIHSVQNQKAQQVMAAEFHQASAVTVVAPQTISCQSSPAAMFSTPSATNVLSATPRHRQHKAEHSLRWSGFHRKSLRR